MISNSTYLRRAGVMAALLGISVFSPDAFSAEPSAKNQPYGTSVKKNNAVWSDEDRYWQENYPHRPYYNKSAAYDIYRPAYRYGMTMYRAHEGKRFEDIDEKELSSGWNAFKGNSQLTWEQARDAVRDAYNRLYDRFSPADKMSTGFNTTPSAHPKLPKAY